MVHNTCLRCLRYSKPKDQTFCSSPCSDRAADEAPSLIEIPVNHVMFDDVSSHFLDGWKGRPPFLWRVYLITWRKHARKRFEDYRSGVESSGNFMSKGLRPCNEKKRFHGADRYCTLGEAGNTTFCGRHNCKLCESITTGFGPYLEMKRRTGYHGVRLGPGLYSTSDASKANKYSKNHDRRARHKAILLCRVVLGEPFITTNDMPSLHRPPRGYDSVHAVAGSHSSFLSSERVVYSERAMMPAYLIIYDE